MYITKTQSRIIASATLFLFFILVFALSRKPEHAVKNSTPNTGSVQDQPKTQDPQDDSKSASSIVLNQFHRSENKDGRLVWEVIAEKGRYFPENNEAKLEDATIWFYRSNGSKVELKAKLAVLFLQGSALIKAEAQNGVSMNYDNQLLLKTEKATYNKEDNSIIAPGVVKISSDQVEITGESLNANVETRDFKIERNVKTVVKARDSATKKQSKS